MLDVTYEHRDDGEYYTVRGEDGKTIFRLAASAYGSLIAPLSYIRLWSGSRKPTTWELRMALRLFKAHFANHPCFCNCVADNRSARRLVTLAGFTLSRSEDGYCLYERL